MFRTRIITFMAHPDMFWTPKTLLTQRTATYALEDKERVFAVRQVFYDESMTPLYSLPRYEENRYGSLVELLNKYPILSDIPILENDNYLKTWNHDN
jgi:hypothetical protein